MCQVVGGSLYWDLYKPNKVDVNLGQKWPGDKPNKVVDCSCVGLTNFTGQGCQRELQIQKLTTTKQNHKHLGSFSSKQTNKKGYNKILPWSRYADTQL